MSQCVLFDGRGQRRSSSHSGDGMHLAVALTTQVPKSIVMHLFVL
jgi:hypothetical protein